MKYKACCEWSCLLYGCKIQDNGGCKCACNISDAISQLESIIDEVRIPFCGGLIYYPDPKDRMNLINKMTEEQRKEWEHYKNVEAPQLLIGLNKRLLEYQIKEDK